MTWLQTGATITALVWAAASIKDDLTHPAFYKRSYRAGAIALTVCGLAMILFAIWT